MVERRPFAGLGSANHGWLDARHHFSFAGYHDPARMGWGGLRVWNDDTIAAQAGFPPHPHADMEIITYVREGAISHRDSQGNQGRTVAGDVQVMSAGTGIVHSEFNLEDQDTRIFQIWILPERRGLPPAWGTRPFPDADRTGRLVTLASGFDEDAEALRINARARVLGVHLRAGETVHHALGPGRFAYLVPATGTVAVNGTVLQPRDGGAVRDEPELQITALADAELVMVDTD